MEDMSSVTNDEANRDIERTIPKGLEEVDALVVDISFSTINEMHAYMQKYAYSKGFGVVKYHNTKDDHEHLKRQTYAYNRAGTRKSNDLKRERK